MINLKVNFLLWGMVIIIILVIFGIIYYLIEPSNPGLLTSLAGLVLLATFPFCLEPASKAELNTLTARINGLKQSVDSLSQSHEAQKSALVEAAREAIVKVLTTVSPALGKLADQGLSNQPLDKIDQQLARIANDLEKVLALIADRPTLEAINLDATGRTALQAQQIRNQIVETLRVHSALDAATSEQVSKTVRRAEEILAEVSEGIRPVSQIGLAVKETKQSARLIVEAIKLLRLIPTREELASIIAQSPASIDGREDEQFERLGEAIAAKLTERFEKLIADSGVEKITGEISRLLDSQLKEVGSTVQSHLLADRQARAIEFGLVLHLLSALLRLVEEIHEALYVKP